MARNFSNVAVATTLTSGVNSSTTAIPVASISGYPSVPFSAILEPGTASEEVVEVTAVIGTTFTATRGVDGTPAQAHGLGTAVVHGVSARDFSEPFNHVDDTTNVHGITNTTTLVTLAGSQTLTNKTLTSPVINGGTISSASLASPTIANFSNATHTHEDDASGGELGTGGGGAFTPVAYKRSGGSEAVSVAGSGVANAVPITLGTEVHSIGNATWSTANSNKRILLPSDISTGYWHVSVVTEMATSNFDTAALVTIYHEDLGLIAANSNSFDAAGSTLRRRLAASTDFSSSAGKWIEVRMGRESVLSESVSAAATTLSLHRIA